jgi:hypothetical protein
MTCVPQKGVDDPEGPGLAATLAEQSSCSAPAKSAGALTWDEALRRGSPSFGVALRSEPVDARPALQPLVNFCLGL